MFSCTTLYFPLLVLAPKVRGWGRGSPDRQVGQSFYIPAQRSWAAGLQRTLSDVPDLCLSRAETCSSQLNKTMHINRKGPEYIHPLKILLP